MGSLFSGARAVPQLPSNMPIGTVFNDLQKKLAAGTGASQGGGSFAERLGQMALTGPGADQRRRVTQPNLLYGNRGTLASGAVGAPYAGATLGGGR